MDTPKTTIPAPPGPTVLTPVEETLALMRGDAAENVRLRARVAALEARLDELEPGRATVRRFKAVGNG